MNEPAPMACTAAPSRFPAINIARSIGLVLFVLALPFGAQAQIRALHFTRTSGYDHNTRSASYAMFTSIADELGIAVDDDATGDPFSDPATLAAYDVVIFSNTSGNAILDAGQRANFELWVSAGGHVLGIHAASDTYRHSSANGNLTGTWDYYPELLGASVQEAPNHVAGTPSHAIWKIGQHPSTAELPDPWQKNEEYYYWENGYYGTENTVVLEVEETIGPNGMVNSYDAPRPMSWYRALPSGSRVFYTALGHAQTDYLGDALFRTHLRDALQWLLNGTSGIGNITGVQSIDLFPNPATRSVAITGVSTGIQMPVQLIDASGRIVLTGRTGSLPFTLDLNGISPGCYTVLLGDSFRTRLLVLGE